MADFLIHELAWYPWLAWLLVVLAGAGLGYVAVWAYKVQAAGFAWLGYRRLVWRSKAAVRRRLLEDGAFDCPTCAGIAADLLGDPGFLAGDDPPEYEHPDGDDDPLPAEPDEDAVVAFLAAVKDMGLLEEDEQLSDGPYVPPEEHGMQPLVKVMPRCEDSECDKYGWVHPPPCLILPTMPVAVYRDGPAMPPQPWSGLHASLEVLARGDDSPTLTGRVAAELGHDTTEAAVDSMWTRAQAREVQAMITDGVITPE